MGVARRGSARPAWRDQARVALVVAGSAVCLLAGSGAAAQSAAGAASDAEPRRLLSVSADLRAALGYTISENRDGSDETDLFPLARLRGALAASPTPWLEARGRFAVFFNEETEDLSFRVAHENDLRPGDVTIDELWVELRPDPRVTIRGGRLQIEDPPFELDSVVLDSLSRHDSSGLDVTWTDGLWAILGRTGGWRLHLIGQANPEEGPTNGVGGRGPVDFTDGASRVTYYAALEAPRVAPLTQLVGDVTVIPAALRPWGVGVGRREDIVAFTARAAADVPFPSLAPVVIHPFLEVGVMASTPRESVLEVSPSRERADGWAVVAGTDLKRLGPGDLGLQAAWVEPGFLLSPDYPNNAWSVETRYKVPVVRNLVLEVRYRHREEIHRLVGARERQAEDNVLARVTFKF